MTWSYLKIKEIQILIMLQNYSQVKLTFSEQLKKTKKNTSKVLNQQSAKAVCKRTLQTLHGPHNTSDTYRTDVKRSSV